MICPQIPQINWDDIGIFVSLLTTIFDALYLWSILCQILILENSKKCIVKARTERSN